MDAEIKSEFIKIYTYMRESADREDGLLKIIKLQDEKLQLIQTQIDVMKLEISTLMRLRKGIF